MFILVDFGGEPSYCLARKICILRVKGICESDF